MSRKLPESEHLRRKQIIEEGLAQGVPLSEIASNAGIGSVGTLRSYAFSRDISLKQLPKAHKPRGQSNRNRKAVEKLDQLYIQLNSMKRSDFDDTTRAFNIVCDIAKNVNHAVEILEGIDTV